MPPFVDPGLNSASGPTSSAIRQFSLAAKDTVGRIARELVSTAAQWQKLRGRQRCAVFTP